MAQDASPSSTASAATNPSAAAGGAANAANILRKYYQQEYPKETWYLFGALIGVLTLFRAMSIVVRFVRRRRVRARVQRRSRFGQGVTEKDTERGGTRNSPEPIPAALRIPVAIANAWKIVWFRSTVNFGFGYTLNVTEAFLTAAYISAIFVWSFVHSQNLTVNWWANRAGTIAAAQFPLITALGTKNNIIGFLTGIGHEQLNYLHRMTSRVALILLWVHGGARLYMMSIKPDYSDLKEGWLIGGLLGTIFLSMLILVSLRPVREKRYEFFVWFHFLVVLIFLVGGYFHVKRYEYDPYIWPCFLIWALDRAMRTARIAYFAIAGYLSLPHASPTKTRGEATKATVALLSPHLLQLRVPRPRGYHWAPGQTAYLVLPGVSTLPCEAHPFTIGSVDAAALPPPAAESSAESKSSSVTDVPALREEGEGGELVFFVGVQEGFTRRLKGVVERSGEGVARVRALVDGPYGRGVDLGRGLYDCAVLVAGGTGVAWTVPVFVDAVRRARALEGQSRLRRLVFVWAIKERSHLSWIAATLAETLALARGVPGLSVCVRVHVTAPNEAWDDDSVHSGEENEKEREADVAGVEVLGGRPDLREVVRGEMEGAGVREMFVGVCGSASLAAAVKAATRVNPFWGPGSVVRGGPSVELVVESFGYA